jgi:hypothetical protein
MTTFSKNSGVFKHYKGVLNATKGKVSASNPYSMNSSRAGRFSEIKAVIK